MNLLGFIIWIPRGPWALTIYTRLFLLVARKEVRQLYENIEKIWGLPRHSNFAKEFARQVARHEIQISLDALRPFHHFTIEGLDQLQQNVNQVMSPRGQLMITAHLGNWELAGACTARVTTKRFYALGKPIGWLTATVDKMRNQFGITTLWTHQQPEKKMLKVLQQGDFLALVMDQKPKGRKGPVVSFFEHPTEFVSGPATLAIRNQLGVIAVFCLRLGQDHYRVISRVLTLPNHEEKDVAALTQRFATEMEIWIRAYPEQWSWNYKRWKF